MLKERRKLKNFEITKTEIIQHEYFQYSIKICDNIARLIRNYTAYPKELLPQYLTKDNELLVRFGLSKHICEQIISEFLRIGNSNSEEYIWKNYLTYNGSVMLPGTLHEIISSECKVKEPEIEFQVTHIFLRMCNLISDPLFSYRSIKEDIEANDCSVLAFECKKE